VVEVVLEKIGEPADGSTVLRIDDPTLATHVGVEVDSTGTGRMVRFNDPTQYEKQDDNDTDPIADEGNANKNPEVDMASENGSGVRAGGVGQLFDDGPIFISDSDAVTRNGSGPDGATTSPNESAGGGENAPRSGTAS